MLNPDWDIKPRGMACAQCQTPFDDGQEFVSTLMFGGEGYQRQDYCHACRAARAPGNKTLVSQWKGVFHAPPPAAPEPLNRENVERMLRDLMTSDEPNRLNVIYILTVILERRRVLVEKDVQKRPDGMLTRVYEHRRTGETFLITDPMLDLNQLEHVRREVNDLLPGSSSASNEAPDGPAPDENNNNANDIRPIQPSAVAAVPDGNGHPAG